MYRKKLFINIITLSLSVALLISAAYCCCLTANAQANGIMPSCSKMTQEDGSPFIPNDEDCECNKTSIFTVEKSTIQVDLVKSLIPLIEESISGTFFISLFSNAYHGPPNLIDNTIPIYLQNSILRI